jgi:hypothetical protein
MQNCEVIEPAMSFVRTRPSEECPLIVGNLLVDLRQHADPTFYGGRFKHGISSENKCRLAAQRGKRDATSRPESTNV